MRRVAINRNNRLLKNITNRASTKAAADKKETIVQTQDTRSLINKSGLFDSTYYLHNNKDVEASGMDPLEHFILYGGFEGRAPSTKFDAVFYALKYEDAIEDGLNPLVHYLTIGKKRGYKPLPFKKNHRKKIRSIAIINVNFFDWDGEVLYKGGAERYVFDLSKLLIGAGYKVDIIQKSNKPFVLHHKGIKVIGVKTKEKSMRGMSKAFAKACVGYDLIIASPHDLACELSGEYDVIGINHGIYWDNPSRRLRTYSLSNDKEIFEAIYESRLVVCVDTNFMNWVQTFDYSLAQRLRYIPNYYDDNQFTYKEKDFDGDLVIAFPRRLYAARGVYVVIDAFKELFAENDNIKLKLVGQTHDDEVKEAVQNLMGMFPGRVTLEEYDMDHMDKAYKDTNIILVPTVNSEGTSLSCIEAMATNNAIVVSTVGGLPNLIINDYNGLIISPNAEDLANAINRLIADRKFAQWLATNALSSAQAFTKGKWEKRWLEIIKERIT